MPLLRVTIAVATAAIVLAGAPTGRAQATPTAVDLAARIQAKYDGIRSFSADFTQSSQSAFLPQVVEDRGQIKVRKPSQLRMSYSTGQKAWFVMNGQRLHAFNPQDRMVDITSLPAGDEASSALLFLAGKGSLTRDFAPSLLAAQPAGEWRLTLTPKRRQDFATLTLEVKRANLTLTGLVKEDHDGGTTAFRFTNLQENVTLADKDFSTTPPPGYRVNGGLGGQ